MQQLWARLLAAISALAAERAWADLGAALRRQALQQGAGASPAAPAAVAAPSGPFVVQLERVEARALAGRRPRHTRDGFYVGNISLGHPPQQLRVLFDTASGHVLVPHRACRSQACLEHRRYSPWESSSSADVNPDGRGVQAGARLARGLVNRTLVTVSFTQSDLGQGEAQGVLVREDVCLAASGRPCANLAVLAATRQDDEPFRAMPHDGIVGLALEGLSAGGLSSFYARLLDASHALLPQFSLSLGPRGGELAFGGHGSARPGAPLRWFPVVRPREGFWQVRILAVRVGNTTADACAGGCRGVIDTGSSSLGAQAAPLRALLPLLASSPAAGACAGPDLALDLGGFSLVLSAEDYAGAGCEPELGSLDLDGPEFAGVYALGTTVLQNYYTAFDWASGRVGFAPVLGRSRPGAAAAAAVARATLLV